MKEYTAIAPGTYRVQLMDLVETTLENPQFGSGDVIRFVLECTDEVDTDGNRYELDGIANDKLTSASKLTRWLAAFGVSAEPGEDIDMSEAVGREAMAVVVLKPGKDGTGGFPRIDELVPLPRGSQKATGTALAPAVIKPDGTADLNVFWTAVRALGITRKNVADHVGGNIEALVAMDGLDVATVLDELKAKATA